MSKRKMVVLSSPPELELATGAGEWGALLTGASCFGVGGGVPVSAATASSGAVVASGLATAAGVT